MEVHYPLHTFSLPNGLRVCVQPDPAAPGVAVNLWYEVGSYDEVAGRTGFAHLFEHLMFQGSAGVASGEHMALIEAHGGSVNATTSTDRTNYFETVPAGALQLALWLEADRMGALALTQENFESQRQVVKEEKRQRYDNQPYGDLLELLTAQHFPSHHPYGHLPIGAMADLDAATTDDVVAFFDTWYGPGNATLVLAGAVGIEQAREAVERDLSRVPGRPRPDHLATHVPLRDPATVRVTRDVPHSVLYTTWTAPALQDDPGDALDLALGILTDGAASRLHRALVKRDRVALDVHAVVLGHLRDHSIAAISVRPTDEAGTDTAGRALADELARFAEEGPTEEEHARALAQFEREWLLDLATVEGRADALNEAWLQQGDPAAVNDRLARVSALTPEDLQRAAARLASPAAELHYVAEADS